jgi:hypothetical protein
MAAGDKNTPTPNTPNNDPKNDLMKMLEGDAVDAGWRLAGLQFLKLTHEPLVAFLSRQMGDEPGLKEKIGAFLGTELGKALVASFLSMGLSIVPANAFGVEYTRRLARELRVKAMTDVGDVVADLLMGPLRQVAVLYLQNMGTKDKAANPTLPADTPRVTAPPVLVPQPSEVAQPVTVGSNRSTNP